MTNEPERARLAADYPRWGITRHGAVLLARLDPPVGFRDATVEGLRQRLEVFDAVLQETGSIDEAEAAALRLET